MYLQISFHKRKWRWGYVFLYLIFNNLFSSKMKQKNCDYCKKKFLYKDNRVKYCGGQCISLFRKQLYKEGKIKTWNKGLIGFKHSGSFQKGKKHWNYGNKGIAAEFTWKGGIANHS